MVNDLLKDIKDLRDEMLSVNWPAQRLSNIILKYEMKLQEEKKKEHNNCGTDDCCKEC
tara:strand:- start:47 stop:220 length:174 start_codon:yes stop_codon:yes gene_type:complete